jgi:hypothetical protein
MAAMSSQLPQAMASLLKVLAKPPSLAINSQIYAEHTASLVHNFQVTMLLASVKMQIAKIR